MVTGNTWPKTCLEIRCAFCAQGFSKAPVYNFWLCQQVCSAAILSNDSRTGFRPGPSSAFSKNQLALTAWAIRIIVSALRSTSWSVVAQLETEIRIAVCPCHTVPPHQQAPSD